MNPYNLTQNPSDIVSRFIFGHFERPDHTVNLSLIMIESLYVSTFFIHYVDFNADYGFCKKIDIVHCPFDKDMILFRTIFFLILDFLGHS